MKFLSVLGLRGNWFLYLLLKISGNSFQIIFVQTILLIFGKCKSNEIVWKKVLCDLFGQVSLQNEI